MIERFGRSFDARVYYPQARVVLDVVLESDQTATINVVPTEVVVGRNSARKADTARIILQRRDFPIDPRLVDAIGVQVHLDGLLEVDDRLTPTRQNLRFAGQADEPEATLDESGQTIVLNCRDFTAIWIDTRWPQGATLPTGPGVTLRQAIERLRSTVEPRSTTKLVFSDPTTADLVVQRRTGRKVFAPDKDEDSYWDVLCALCELYGLVPVYDLDRLVIRTPTAIGTRRVAFTYGQDVERLKYKRSFKRQKRRQVVVRAWNPEEGKTYEAVWPKDGGETATTTTTEETTTKTIHRVQYSVEGLYDQASALALAQIIYDEQAQLQLTGEITTRELEDAEGRSVLDLANGDRLALDIDPTPDREAAGTVGEAIERLTDTDRVDPYRLGPAQLLAQSWTDAAKLDEWYILEVEHSWSASDGYAARITFSEYVVER